MPKHRRSWGSITQVRRGAWRLRYVRNTPEGRKRVSEMVYGSRRDADRVLAARRVEVESPPVPTVEQVFDKYIRPQIYRECRPNTVAAYEQTWNRHVSPAFGRCPIDQIKPMAIQQMIDNMPGGTAPQAVHLLRRVTQWAFMQEMVDRDPCSGKFVYPERNRGVKAVFSLADLDRVWEAVRGSYVEAPFIFAAHAGLRVGEAIAVRRDALEFSDTEAGFVCLVNVCRQCTKDKMTEILKTKASYRTAIVTEPWSLRLEELCGGLEAEDYLCVTPRGVPSQEMLRYRWRSLLEGAGMKYVPFRNLRNSYETYMRWERGIEVKTLSQLMGHANSAVTLAHYDRPDGERIVLAALSEMGRTQLQKEAK